MNIMLMAVLLLFLNDVGPEDPLTGRWQSPPSPKGNVTGIVFRADGSFDAYLNKKPFTSGSYTFRDSVMSFVDTGCEGKRARYKLVFFSYADSLRFIPVSDSCTERKEGMSRLVLGRVK